MKNGSPAFSLVEIVLAIGVVAFAVVAILGMLPVAMNSALESQRESRAAFIAKFIQSNLRATRFESAQCTGNSTWTRMDLGTTGNLTVAFDKQGTPLEEISDAQYQSGVSSSTSAMFLAHISTTPVTGSGLAMVVIEVSTPAAAARATRRSFPFSTLIANPSVATPSPAP